MKKSDRIWITKKSRMEAEKRFNKYDFISKLLLTYYSSFTLILSLYDYYNGNINYSLSITSSSILILIVSLLVSSLKFKERALAHKQCYILLDELQSDTEQVEKNDESLEEINKRYNDILNLTENHSTFDYISMKVNTKGEEEHLKVNKLEYCKFIYEWIKYIVVLLFVITLPFLIFCWQTY